jgi:hypothetical protein
MKVTENPLAGSTLLNWLRLLGDNGAVDRRYWARALFVTAATVGLSPLRLAQSALFGRRIGETAIDSGPVFIIGHYRSGTTFLQNLLARDPQLGFVSTTQAVFPGGFLLGGPVRSMLGLFLPDKRPMDEMEMSPVLPEEPEHAVANLSRCAFYHGLCFPRSMMHYFRRYVLFEGASESEIEEWRRTYLTVLRAATLASDGKRLVVKNPPDAARIPHLLEMFPDARFIFIHRNPYVMFPSIENFFSTSIRDWQLQEIDEEEIRENIFAIFAEVHGRYYADRGRIPAGHLVEVGFEEMERSPLALLGRIYDELGLPGFSAAEPAFRDYAESKVSYRKNRYSPDRATIEQISERWGGEVERWGYAIPSDLGGDG